MAGRLAAATLGLIAGFAVAAATRAAEQIVTVPTRSGVTQAYLLRHDPAAAPKVAAILFPGGDGLLNLRVEDGAIKYSLAGNFLVRTRDLLQDAEVAVAVIDVPSELLRRGYSDEFRASKDHAADVLAVVADLRSRFTGAKVFLVGTSRGTVSAAYAARHLGSAIDGVVLTSTLFLASRGGFGLSGFDFGDIRVPLLLVHHVDDGCFVTPYSSAQALAPKIPLVSVSGGLPPRSQPCEARSQHGFLGRETATIAAIRDWMLGRPIPERID